MYSSSPFPPHHHQLSSPVAFLLDSCSPFYSECPSPASSSMSSSPSFSASGNRNRINMACLYCRYRKIKCDGGSPCTTCARTKRCCQYQEVSDDVNRATKERKAYLKSLRIQSLGRIASAPSPRRRRGVSVTSSSSSAPSSPAPQLSPSAFIDGWTPTPPSPTTTTPFSRPFPSVLMGTPLHAAFEANLSRSPSSPAEDQTYSQIRRPSGSQTPPRSRSPSPQPYHSISNYSTPALSLPGYSSHFVDPSSSPSSSVASSQAPSTPVFASSFQPNYYYYDKCLNPSSPPTSPEGGAPFVVAPSSYSSSYPAATTVDLAQEPIFYLPPSPEVKRHSRFASMQQQFFEGEGRNPGLGLDLPEGFAPGLPSGGAGYYEEEMAQQQTWASGGGGGGTVVEESEMIVFQGWGTA
ncbi:hypothetical protein BDY24DRAFT_438648 [Mrakia frigida]|uniref:Zn(II)2Cys6 transcription factor domain-containing protein n=1 Tax=Mrakia frigida TaxID=29902 RepID=UPI003FCBFB65